MSNLNTNEKRILEKLFQMESGYVLDFSDRTMGEFFHDSLSVDIDATRYHYGSGSKANRMRGFWQVASDPMVAQSIRELVDYIKNQIMLEHIDEAKFSNRIIDKSLEIADRLDGKTRQEDSKTVAMTEQQFVAQNFDNVSLNLLKLDTAVEHVIAQRIKEIEKCLNAGAPLSVVFLCGSTLEGILLGIASQNPAIFNQATAAPRKEGKVLQFNDWSLSNFIDTSRELSIIGDDVKKFSHSLRDFRNYIHPYQQLISRFDPQQHTAKISWQVLQAAIYEIGQYQSK